MNSKRPRRGERFEVIEPFTAGVLTTWKAPFTGGYEKVLPRGLRFVVSQEPPQSANAVAADPEPALQWEQQLVDEEDRSHPKYGGYYLVVGFDKLQTHCMTVT